MLPTRIYPPNDVASVDCNTQNKPEVIIKEGRPYEKSDIDLQMCTEHLCTIMYDSVISYQLKMVGYEVISIDNGLSCKCQNFGISSLKFLDTSHESVPQ